MLDFRTNTFLTVCETMNFTEAAKRLNITQPAVRNIFVSLKTNIIPSYSCITINNCILPRPERYLKSV